LKSIYDSDGLVGAVLVEGTDLGASIPRAQFEEPAQGDSGPIDMYYCDLDGLWTDADQNGFFETWENGPNGDMAVEIWVGRMSTIMTAGDRLTAYFDRNHAWRTGVMTFPERALTWIESGWAQNNDVDEVYDDVVAYHQEVDDPFTPELYHDELQNGYEYHFLAAHGGPSGTSNGWIWAWDVHLINPQVGFYHLWCCQAGDYGASPTCLGAEFAFGNDYGLLCRAWVNSGGRWTTMDYYGALRDGKSIAEATMAWFATSEYPDGSYHVSFIDWEWGHVLFGDPTLRPQQIRITDAYWDEATSSVKITFSSKSDLYYTLERADADAYTDGLSWSTVTSTIATGKETTLADDLSTPLSADFRFYRVRRNSGVDTSRQVVGLFELDIEIGWTMQDFFISTPLIPDADHASVQDVIGTQIDRNAPNIRQRVADTGLNNRMVYNRAAGTWSADVGAAFDIVVGEGYKLFAGGGIAQTLTLRLTGYVPEQDGSVLVQKPGWTQTDRWVACAMPQARTLDTLGLRESVTGWNSMNALKLRPLGASVWSTYKWDGAKWYDVNTPGVDAGSTPIACGEAAVFTRFGTPTDQDEWAQPTWYDDPPR